MKKRSVRAIRVPTKVAASDRIITLPCHRDDCPEVRLLRAIVEQLRAAPFESAIVTRYDREVLGKWPDELPLIVSGREGQA